MPIDADLWARCVIEESRSLFPDEFKQEVLFFLHRFTGLTLNYNANCKDA